MLASVEKSTTWSTAAIVHPIWSFFVDRMAYPRTYLCQLESYKQS